MRSNIVQWIDHRNGLCWFSGPAQPCWHCGQPTQFISIDFQAYIHPQVCADAKWAEFEQALKGKHLEEI